ncbi:hypothetical protein VC83_01645 [Pseudogymnoascus destructans]|uniref:Uncharacterized protein n=1 Tax=Pseudogymnoascus destructans TaxID=655981 RepID=A0A177AIH4_9PEZI|nr:uncharacterized protein VC83_01645 [Pseudogymnoascus destructans]OAF61876.1 hypothetical protein VC83_01645 [Pseudogymnoascus destructans]
MEEEEQPEEPAPTAKEAQDALRILIEYSEGQDALTTGHIQALERLQTAFEAIQAQSQQQKSNYLAHWLGCCGGTKPRQRRRMLEDSDDDGTSK